MNSPFSRKSGAGVEMTPEQKKEFYDKVRCQLERMLGLIHDDAPDIIMCGEITTLWWRYVGKFPQGMIQTWFDDMIGEAMRRSARCTGCGADIPPEVTHVPCCGKCEKELEKIDKIMKDGVKDEG